jgi:hypothetical protein
VTVSESVVFARAIVCGMPASQPWNASGSICAASCAECPLEDVHQNQRSHERDQRRAKQHEQHDPHIDRDLRAPTSEHKTKHVDGEKRNEEYPMPLADPKLHSTIVASISANASSYSFGWLFGTR